ncbi:uncharacterized ATP-dependent helicase C29A10.10c-like [Rhodamnia argentea]|uniref:Uncharacterized ATP-dependent helicase C29A10.10c-like n=1 Tax=Rhodamnia argentea TaxID=178133 RepID=A0A8B8QQS1_9MYRT|nr:uncharacterized ATP-dependent helicase C29A10.10c-like [Rhodamnia argentea]
MTSRGRPMFDLNEPPPGDDENDTVNSMLPQKALPSSNPHSSTVLASSVVPQRIVNNNAFSHASSVSGFQPFVRPKAAHMLGRVEQKNAGDRNCNVASSSKLSDAAEKNPVSLLVSDSVAGRNVEREEGEWSDDDGSADPHRSSSLHEPGKASRGKGTSELEDTNASGLVNEIVSCNGKISESGGVENSASAPTGLNLHPNDSESNDSHNVEGNAKIDTYNGVQEEDISGTKQKEVKGIEASYALKCANNPGKRKMDQHKEAMLGKKRNRQTMFLNLEDVKQAGQMKTSTPRRLNFSSTTSTRSAKETRTIPPPPERVVEKLGQSISKDLKRLDVSAIEGGNTAEQSDSKSECNGDVDGGVLAKPKKMINSNDPSAEVSQPSRQSSWKQPMDLRQPKSSPLPSKKPGLISQISLDLKSMNKKHLAPKKQTIINSTYQDTSVERLIREVTNEKFWQQPGETDLQCVPGRFESVEEYIRVFEPLLFEECRAQLYSTWEELSETFSRDTHIMVRVRNIERRERGWYDVTVLPVNECKWMFKEGDVAVLSTPRPGSFRSKRNNFSVIDEGDEPDITGRVAGTVRRFMPIDTRDPPGAILHFYVGDSYDPSSEGNEDHILRKLQPRGIWYLTVLGSLATTQREYIALHAFRRLNLQMQTAILQPSPEQFPNYEQQIPAMPECFTQKFAEHLNRTFNGPQLSAIQWAAMHTAAGTSSGTTKRQEPWPFTLVQGPPGTGKTHTVWGMLNVIHLVQYQHYYNSLLKKLAPESYKQPSEGSSDNNATGSIDEVLQSMDQSLFRTLPKLCPKPRMLVCAPSNAATDELLARVLDRGFIDGEMRIYKPDVARVGVDSQTRAAQAVSVERRTEQLLAMGKEEVYAWLHRLRNNEAQFSQEIAEIQSKLNSAAAAIRSQGSVGVDPDVLMARDQNRDALLKHLAQAVENRDKVLVEMSRILIVEVKFRTGSNFNLEEARASLEASYANEAEIVFTTVSSSGRKLFSRLSHGFDMVVIDEAAQASEVAVLPPLSLGAARCVLVGDPQQLPATVISKAAGTLLYSRSLFERFQQAGCPTMLLSVQYRMHPQIRDFPSRYFYQGRLNDSESVVKLPDEVYYRDPLLRPYIFYDITHGRESHRGGSVSYQNIHEAQFCLRIYEHLQKNLKSTGVGKISVGIITPYKLQLKCLQREFEEVLNSEEGKDIYINTVDAFQGQERDVIIMSCVRASSHGVGFVADIRRMNVALTRAKRALWVMGNANALIQSDDWAALIADAKARNCYMDMDSVPKEFYIPKGPTLAPLPGKAPLNSRGLRSSGRHRSTDMHTEPRSAVAAEDDEKLPASLVSRNGNFRPLKPPVENSLEGVDQVGDRSRESWQYGAQKKQQSSSGPVWKRDY